MSIDNRLRDALRSIVSEEPPSHILQRATAALPPRAARHRFLAIPATAAAVAVIVIAAGLVVISSPGRDQLRGPGAEIPASALPTSVSQLPTAPVLPTELPSSTAAIAPTELPSPVVEPSPNAQPSPGLVATAPATPPLNLSERERSERYWNAVTDYGLYGQRYDSLEDITRAVHLVIRGRVTGFQPGQIHPFASDLGPRQTIFGIVTVDEVLKGEPQMKVPGTVLVAELGWPDMTLADLPSGEAIFFLMNYAQQREEDGVAPSADENDRFYYARPNGYQAVLVNLGGRVEVPADPADDWPSSFPSKFPARLDGVAFDEVAASVRDIVGDTP